MRYQSQRISQIPPYMFAEFNKKKQMMQEAGVDVIDLGIGDPDLPTPQHITDKLIEEMAYPENFKYPSFIGCLDFRKAVAEFYKREFNVDLDPETEVLALIGSKEGLAHLVPTMIDPGEIVLAPDPGYPPYRMAVSLAGGKLHTMPLLQENNFEPDFQKIPENVAAEAKLMFLNYPGNPTAATVDVNFFAKLCHLPSSMKSLSLMMLLTIWLLLKATRHRVFCRQRGRKKLLLSLAPYPRHTA